MGGDRPHLCARVSQGPKRPWPRGEPSTPGRPHSPRPLAGDTQLPQAQAGPPRAAPRRKPGRRLVRTPARRVTHATQASGDASGALPPRHGVSTGLGQPRGSRGDSPARPTRPTRGTLRRLRAGLPSRQVPSRGRAAENPRKHPLLTRPRFHRLGHGAPWAGGCGGCGGCGGWEGGGGVFPQGRAGPELLPKETFAPAPEHLRAEPPGPVLTAGIRARAGHSVETNLHTSTGHRLPAPRRGRPPYPGRGGPCLTGKHRRWG